MAIVLSCPECDTTLKLPVAPAPGKRVQCPQCKAIFGHDAGEVGRVSADRPVAPARPRPRPADDADDRDWDERRPRRPRQKQGGGNGLMIGLLVGGGVLVLLMLGCVGVIGFAIYSLREAPATKGPVAASRAVAPNNNPAPPPPQANNPAPPPADNNPPPAQGEQPPNPPFPGGIPQPPAPPGFPGGMQPGNQEGSVVLSNARVFRRGVRMEASVDYKWVKGGPGIGQHVFVIIKSGRHTYEASVFPTHVQTEGTFNLSGISFGADRGPFEFYLETGMPGPFGQRQKISNTVTAN